jgi:glycosyltransferase involved in cell wall biosynthesis
MTILFIAAPFPYPPDTGSRNLIFHWLDAACQKHEVHLIAIEEPNGAERDMPELPNLQIEVLHTPVGRSLPARFSRLAASAARGIPATSLVYMSRGVERRILERIQRHSYDAVVLTENVVAGFAPSLASRVPIILFKHSVQAVDARDARKRYGLLHPRWLLAEWIVRRFEAQTCRAASMVCCVNREDANDLVSRYNLARTPEVVPIGVELKRFPRRTADPGGKVIGFFGNLSWGANSDAVIWFANRVLPIVWKEHPDATFWIIGPGSGQLQLQTDDRRIVRIGSVPQPQIPEAMKGVTVGVVPVISGTGVRLKLLEMLSMGIPVVATPLGSLGTRCVHREHLLIAKDPDSFATAVSLLLSDETLRQRLSQAGAKIAPTHAWESFYPSIMRLLEEAAGQGTTRHSDTMGVAMMRRCS